MKNDLVCQFDINFTPAPRSCDAACLRGCGSGEYDASLFGPPGERFDFLEVDRQGHSPHIPDPESPLNTPCASHTMAFAREFSSERRKQFPIPYPKQLEWLFTREYLRLSLHGQFDYFFYQVRVTELVLSSAHCQLTLLVEVRVRICFNHVKLPVIKIRRCRILFG